MERQGVQPVENRRFVCVLIETQSRNGHNANSVDRNSRNKGHKWFLFTSNLWTSGSGVLKQKGINSFINMDGLKEFFQVNLADCLIIGALRSVRCGVVQYESWIGKSWQNCYNWVRNSCDHLVVSVLLRTFGNLCFELPKCVNLPSSCSVVSMQTESSGSGDAIGQSVEHARSCVSRTPTKILVLGETPCVYIVVRKQNKTKTIMHV